MKSLQENGLIVYTGLIVEVGHEGVFPAVLLHYHPLVAEHGDERYRLFMVQLYTYRILGLHPGCLPQGYRTCAWMFRLVFRISRRTARG